MKNILIHGLGQNNQSWDNIVINLKKNKMNTICPNLFEINNNTLLNYKNLYDAFSDFCNTKPIIINGYIKNIKRTNLSYMEPHRVIIKGITFLVFNYSKTIYIVNLRNSFEIKDLEGFIKSLNCIKLYQLLSK